jgi:anti-sigma B factor antagonist
MPELSVTMTVTRPNPSTSVISIKGDVSNACEKVLMDVYQEAVSNGATAVVLDFTEVEYINSGGIGLLVTLLVRANRNGQRVLASGLSDHYRHIFELTRLEEAISIYDTEADAVAAAAT